MTNELDEYKATAKSLARRLDRNTHGHMRMALRLQRFDDIATFVNVIGGVTTLALSMVLLGKTFGGSHVVEIALACVSGLITLVGVAQAVWKPGERSSKHKAWAAKFAALENDCYVLLSGQAGKSLPQIFAESEAVFDGADLVPKKIWPLSTRRSATDQAS